MSKRPTLRERLDTDSPHVADALVIVLSVAEVVRRRLPGELCESMEIEPEQLSWAFETVFDMCAEEVRDQCGQNGWKADA